MCTMISTFPGVRTCLKFKVLSGFCLKRNNTFLTWSNPSQCGISLSTSLSMSLFLSLTTYDATKNHSYKECNRSLDVIEFHVVEFRHPVNHYAVNPNKLYNCRPCTWGMIHCNMFKKANTSHMITEYHFLSFNHFFILPLKLQQMLSFPDRQSGEGNCLHPVIQGLHSTSAGSIGGHGFFLRRGECSNPPPPWPSLGGGRIWIFEFLNLRGGGRQGNHFF